MSDTKNEPLAAILAEMRHRADDYRQLGWESVGEELDGLADRIDAAAEREARVREQAAADYALKRVEDIISDRCSNCTERAPGNAAALREALEKCAELGDQIDNCLGSDEATVWNCRNERSAAHNIILTARAALAAQARNCDRFANWMRAWDGYLAKYPDAKKETPFEIGRYLNWLFAPAEGGDHA